MKTNIKAIYNLINKYFWKSIVGPVISFLLPICFMAIYLIMSNAKNDFTYFINGLASYISLAILPLSMLTLPSLVVEFRNSILLRKIKTSGIKSYQLIGILMSYFLAMIIAILLIVVCFFALGTINNTDKLKHINWGTLIYGILMMIISSLAIGIFMAMYSKSIMNIQIIGICFILITLLLSGQLIPLSVIGTVKAINYLSLISPISYSANILNIATYQPLHVVGDLTNFSNNLFDLTKAFGVIGRTTNPDLTNKFEYIIVYDIWQKVLFIIVPIMMFIIFNVLSIKFFKWSGR